MPPRKCFVKVFIEVPLHTAFHKQHSRMHERRGVTRRAIPYGAQMINGMANRASIC